MSQPVAVPEAVRPEKSIDGETTLRVRAVQAEWRRVPPARRREYFARLRGVLSRDSEETARIIAQDTGKSPLEALAQEVIPAIDTAFFLEKEAERILRPRRPRLRTRQFYFGGKRNEIRREPYGVVGILGAWNYPFFLSISQVLFALAAGNGVILKGAGETPRVTERIGALLAQAGFPRDLVFCFSGGAAAGEALCRAGCDKYILTGSAETGRRVSGILSERPAPSVMELSGCDAYLVFSDADLGRAVKTLLWAAFQHSGQTCVAPRRVLYLARDRKRFFGVLGKEWRRLEDFLGKQGRLHDARRGASERTKVLALRPRGAKLIFGRDFPADEGIFPPQIYEVSAAAGVAGMDFMAPVFFMTACADEEDMLVQANAGPFGLGASVWTSDPLRAERFASAIRVGQVWVNDAIFSAALAAAPFGGTAGSGFGRTRGEEGLLEMTQAKFVSFGRSRAGASLHLPPYRRGSFGLLNALQKVIYGTSFKSKAAGVGDLLRAATGHDHPEEE